MLMKWNKAFSLILLMGCMLSVRQEKLHFNTKNSLKFQVKTNEKYIKIG